MSRLWTNDSVNMVDDGRNQSTDNSNFEFIVTH